MTRKLAAALAPLALTACSVAGIRDGYEAPAYEVVAELAPGIEVRRYGARLAAQASAEASGVREGRNSAFRLLFDYISGANEGTREIAMTVPVETTGPGTKIDMTAPVETNRGDDGTTRMRFFLPAEFTPETAPRPTDARVSLVTLEPRTMAVLRFTGSTGSNAVRRETTKLMTQLKAGPWRAQGAPVAYFYDPPWTLPFMRRNEVAVAVNR